MGARAETAVRSVAIAFYLMLLRFFFRLSSTAATLKRNKVMKIKKTPENKLFIELIDFLHDSIFFSLFAYESFLWCRHCSPLQLLATSFRSWNSFRTFSLISPTLLHYHPTHTPECWMYLVVRPAAAERQCFLHAKRVMTFAFVIHCVIADGQKLCEQQHVTHSQYDVSSTDSTSIAFISCWWRAMIPAPMAKIYFDELSMCN